MRNCLGVAAVGVLSVGLLALAPADATAPRSRAHPVSSRAFCTGAERVHGRVTPKETANGDGQVVVRFWLTGAAAGSEWGFGVEYTSEGSGGAGGSASDGVVTADENGRVDLGITGVGGLHRDNFFRLVAEKYTDSALDASSSCLLTLSVQY